MWITPVGLTLARQGERMSNTGHHSQTFTVRFGKESERKSCSHCGKWLRRAESERFGKYCYRCGEEMKIVPLDGRGTGGNKQ